MNYFLPFQEKVSINNQPYNILERLVEALDNSYKLFMNAAEKATNRKVQIMVFDLAAESYEYYKELVSQIQNFDFNFYHDIQNVDIGWNIVKMYNDYIGDNTEEILEECLETGNLIIRKFTDLLNNPVINVTHKKLLQQQLNSFLYAFVKLKNAF